MLRFFFILLVAPSLVLGPSPTPAKVGVIWHHQATVDAQSRQRLRDRVVADFGVESEQVVDDADLAAQRWRAHVTVSGDAQELSDLDARLRLAESRFRTGDLEGALDETRTVLERLRAAATLPYAHALAWRVRMLMARIAWLAGDASQELGNAVALDPYATLSTRRVPPDFLVAYEARRAEVLAQRSEWTAPGLRGVALDEGGVQIEIDGQPGLREVPQGEHFVVVRRLGAVAVGYTWTQGSLKIELPPVTIPAGLAIHAALAESICVALGLEAIVLARLREGRLGAQTYRCGNGYASPWYSQGTVTHNEVWAALEQDNVVAAEGSPERARCELLDATPWPQPQGRPHTTLLIPEDRIPITVPKPWYKRAWVWSLVAGVVVAGVTTGAVLGTREPTRTLTIPSDEFLKR